MASLFLSHHHHRLCTGRPPLHLFSPTKLGLGVSNQTFPTPSSPSATTTPKSRVVSRSSSSRPAETGCPVPVEQQPINEYQNLSSSFPFSWASECTLVEFSSRLFVAGASFALLVGLPVVWFGSVGGQEEPLKKVLAAASSGLLVVSLGVLRMYLGWAYVGNRLLSATVEYEETGWYDGQIWVKTPEVLARDRLLGSFTVKPILDRLKSTLVTLAASLFVSAVLFVNVDGQDKFSSLKSEEAGGRAIPGVYNDDSARSFEPDAFCGEGELPTL